ncbi:MAG: alanine dehydrogenase [Phycisphaeraceae bacterium]|nr:MAG: alanine dehydrogenase [Phycisphaeraceae bacterium]
MIVGVPREVKSDEYRVGLLPVGAELLKREGHTVLVETGAGDGSGFDDEQYTAAGAEIAPTAADVWAKADMIVKVKEPQTSEIPHMRTGQQVFTYFHFAADKDLTVGCLESGACCIAYECVEAPGPFGRPVLPLLTPMSEVAGKMSIQQGAKYLERPQEGRGILLGGVPGVEPGEVLILGGGVVGSNAARMAAGLGANVTILDVDLDRLRYLSEVMPANVTTIYSEIHAIRHYLEIADLVVGAVLIHAAKAPKLVLRDDLKRMKNGAVIVDVAIDQGGCVETAKATTHRNPTYIIDSVVHYCVANMPGAVGRTSTQALTNATLPWVIKIARHGAHELASKDRWFKPAINMDKGRLLNRPVAEAHELEWTEN